ncbi:MAG TPA: hypothetical protein VKV25_07495, partial [Acidimicrobiales bacterium]|nr:hypothetical protein [Acidimicrobiales bacterium]
MVVFAGSMMATMATVSAEPRGATLPRSVAAPVRPARSLPVGAPVVPGSLALDLTGVACPSSADCEAVGDYEDSSGQHVPLAEQWNGSSWAMQTIPPPKSATDLGTYLSGVGCSSPTSCEAIGYYYNTSGNFVTLGERWNGTSWAIQTTPNAKSTHEDYLTGVACPSATSCEAVGYYYNTAHNPVTLGERWNGTSWAIQTTPNGKGSSGSYLEGVSCSSSADCSAVGDDYNGANAYSTLAEQWNGTTWARKTIPSPKSASGTSTYLSGVGCAPSAQCEAVGAYANKSNTNVTLGERWNGSSWAMQTTPNAKIATDGTYLAAAGCPSSTDCESVGYYYTSSSHGSTLGERWNG